MQIGREVLYTSEPVITYDNIIPILQKLFQKHQHNATEITRLVNFEKGEQPIVRKKKYRPEIDCQCVDNVANEVTDFKTSFHWGNPITLVQHGENNDDSEITEGISILNSCYEAEGIRKKTQHLARNVEIGCLGYTYVDLNMDEMDIALGGSYFKIESLEPTNTCVIRSSYYFDKRPMIGVMYAEDDESNKYITAFTKDFRFELKNWEHTERSGELNPLGAIPIIEWIRSYDMMGCFERQITEMNNLNLLVSDFTNDIEQNTQVVWHTVDVEFPTVVTKNEDGTETEETRKPKSNEWLQTYSTADGKTPKISPLVVDYDYTGMLNNIISRRSLILQKCNVPMRYESAGGGSTGVAMDTGSGWSAAEAEAQKQQNIMEACKMEEVRVVLRAIQVSPYVPADSPLLKLKFTDIQPNIKRSKTYELSVKTNAIATLLSHGFDLRDAVTVAPLFEDNNQVIERSGDGVKKYQESNVFKEEKSSEINDKPFADYSDEQQNSPLIGGMSKTE